jgi:hypothetical protein
MHAWPQKMASKDVNHRGHRGSRVKSSVVLRGLCGYRFFSSYFGAAVPAFGCLAMISSLTFS